VKGTKEETGSVEGLSGRQLAERWGLAYREAHTLSVDPAALELLDREESRRLGVLPLEVGNDGPVFALAEPSEERFTEVRELAGANATFVVVAQGTLDALMNSKVFSAPNPSRRPSLFRSRTDGQGPYPTATGATLSSVPPVELSADETTPEPLPARQPSGDADPDRLASTQRGDEVPSGETESTALESPFSQIASGAGSLRAQVDEMSHSLEDSRRELGEANAQLAEARQLAESHNATVGGLKAEIGTLREQLASSTAVNDSMRARLEEVARSLLEPAPARTGG
jgi:Type II secretion system (T2SS), protein E, N-terminal domain